MQSTNSESLKAEKSHINHLLDEENRICAKCTEKNESGCEGCFHEKRKRSLTGRKERVITALAGS